MDTMPLVKIEIIEGKSKEFKKKLLDIVHNSLVKVFGIPASDRTQRLYELKTENFEIPPEKTEDAILIEITVFPGRSEKTKKKLYREIVNNIAAELNISKKEITIVLYEPPLVNWGIKGGKPASKVNLGFNLKA